MKREGERGLPEIWRWVQLKEEKGNRERERSNARQEKRGLRGTQSNSCNYIIT
jgi:hypothetical protein